MGVKNIQIEDLAKFLPFYNSEEKEIADIAEITVNEPEEKTKKELYYVLGIGQIGDEGEIHVTQCLEQKAKRNKQKIKIEYIPGDIYFLSLDDVVKYKSLLKNKVLCQKYGQPIKI